LRISHGFRVRHAALKKLFPADAENARKSSPERTQRAQRVSGVVWAGVLFSSMPPAPTPSNQNQESSVLSASSLVNALDVPRSASFSNALTCEGGRWRLIFPREN
jgi:hypothetical protein